MTSVISNRSSGSDKAPQHRRRFSRGSSTSPRQSGSFGAGERVISWGLGLNAGEEEEAGIQPYPSESASSAPSLGQHPDVLSTHVSNVAELGNEDVSLGKDSGIACWCALFVVWNAVAAYIAVITIHMLGYVGVVLTVVLLLPPLILGVRTAYYMLLRCFYMHGGQDEDAGHPDEGCMLALSFSRAVVENLVLNISQYPRRLATAIGICTGLSGLSCMFWGFTLQFWGIHQWPMAMFMTVFSLPFTLSALLADGYVLLGFLGRGFQGCGKFHCLRHLDDWLDRLGACVGENLMPEDRPQQILFLLFQGVVFVVGTASAIIYGRETFIILWEEAPGLVTLGLLAFLAPFCVYGAIVVYVIFVRCILLVDRCVCRHKTAAACSCDAESLQPERIEVLSHSDYGVDGVELVEFNSTINAV